MDAKLTMMFLLIGAVIALSKANDDSIARLRSRFARPHWRELVPGRRKS
ncbi:MAG TPA: hypothetical protein VFL51_04105 [Pseudolabrys sp.]|nr:hypothetical protein [Pseudolabrys sp.]